MSEIVEPTRLLRREKAQYRRSLKRLIQRIQRNVKLAHSFNKLEKQVLERIFVSWVEKMDESTAISLWDFVHSSGRRKDDFEEALFGESIKLEGKPSLNGQGLSELAERIKRDVDKRRRKWLSGEAFEQAEKLKNLVKRKEKEKRFEKTVKELHGAEKTKAKELGVFGVIDKNKIKRVDWSKETGRVRSEMILSQAEKDFDSSRFMLDFEGKKKKVKK